MYSYAISDDQPIPNRLKKKRASGSRINLETIEETDGDVDFQDDKLSPHWSPKDGRPSPSDDEKWMRFTETPCSEMLSAEREVLRDKFGFPLFPQPLDDPNDPLTWSKAAKIRILVQISLHSFLSLFSAFVIVSIQTL